MVYENFPSSNHADVVVLIFSISRHAPLLKANTQPWIPRTVHGRAANSGAIAAEILHEVQTIYLYICAHSDALKLTRVVALLPSAPIL